MLKGKRSVSACSLSSCRIRAEALARAFNTRIWPCVWMQPRSSSADREDGMSNGIDDEEEFFDASPSPVEVEDESLFCQQHSSAATEAGRAKLYELLQQHATDDAIDVFYDVTEDAGLSDTCLKDEAKVSEERDNACQSSQCPDGQLEDESYFSNTSDGNDVDNECTLNGSQNICEPVENELENNLDSECYEEHKKNNLYLEKPVTQQTIAEDSHKSVTETGFDNPEYRYENPSQTENMGLMESENVINQENVLNEKHGEASECSLKFEERVLNENGKIYNVNNNTNIELPSVESTFLKQNGNHEVGVLNISDECVLKISPGDEKCVANVEVNNVAIEITQEAESPSTSPIDKTVKTSPTCRLKVFDEIRPQILRTTSLKTGKTPPGTPSRKKIVRFADVLGLDLEDVRHIMSGDLPIIPSSAYTDLNLKDVDLPSSRQTFETIEICRRDTSSWQVAAATTSGIYPMFPIPGEQPDFIDRLRFQGICLETVIVSEMTVQCTCRVMNYGYHKKVIARYTFNDWLSSNDIDASYILGSSNCETDSFSFSIFLSPQNKNVKFALKYEVNDKEYWDNNRSLNYCLSYHGTDNMQHLPSPESWQHQFW